MGKRTHATNDSAPAFPCADEVAVGDRVADSLGSFDFDPRREGIVDELQAADPNLAELYRALQRHVRERAYEEDSGPEAGELEISALYDDLVEQHNSLVDELDGLAYKQRAQRRAVVRLEKLAREQARQLRRQGRALADLARAIGACPRCLGRDPDCELCAGVGAPGCASPDPQLFDRWVGPAVAKRQAPTEPKVVAVCPPDRLGARPS